ncbi:L,D-transpeptidase family protein [Paracoccaceae bacterium Fryx2]|nr:L,D-transpeptidase family protein [Paracoccaceae bacterium Fryx2]
MKIALKIFLALVLSFALTACSSKFRTYRGPEVTSIQVHKADRKMYLLHHGKVLASYDVALGFSPVGHKQFEGDGKTPEGSYFIDRRNPNSEFHLSVGMSYPNEFDKEFAASQGRSPGGDIFIHGHTGFKRKNKGDWTAGCIAVTDREMEVIYSMIRKGTPIHILP